MQQNIRVFVGLDTSKMKISVALAEEGRQGEVRFLGDIDNTPDADEAPSKQADWQVPTAAVLL